MGLRDRIGRWWRGGDTGVPSSAEVVTVADPDEETSHESTRVGLLYPKATYQGEFSPKNLAFDSNLQEFAQKVSFICNLENSGKISPNDAHQQIRALWKELARSHHGLNMEEPDSPPA